MTLGRNAVRIGTNVRDTTHFEISHHEVYLAHLPGAFHGMTVVQISDMHVDRWNLPIVEAAIPQINALKPDLVVCTGDTIAHGNHYLGDLTFLLRQIHAKTGKIACLGNHDYSDGSRSHGVRHALGQAGFDVLVNDSTLITQNHQQINLAGADDLILGDQCLKKTHRRIRPEVPTLLLSHNPSNFKAMATFKPDLILSGHTHGGQIPIPSFVHRILSNSPYLAGHYRHGNSHLYVNKGLGASVLVHRWKDFRLSLPTPRWRIRAEISVFKLLQTQKPVSIHSTGNHAFLPSPEFEDQDSRSPALLV